MRQRDKNAARKVRAFAKRAAMAARRGVLGLAARARRVAGAWKRKMRARWAKMRQKFAKMRRLAAKMKRLAKQKIKAIDKRKIIKAKYIKMSYAKIDTKKPNWNMHSQQSTAVSGSVGKSPKIPTKISKVPKFKHKKTKNPNPNKIKGNPWESFIPIGANENKYENFEEVKKSISTTSKSKYTYSHIYTIIILLTILTIYMS